MGEMVRPAVRTIRNLPVDVTPGAREVAIVTGFRSVQEDALKPVMDALDILEKLSETEWRRGYLVAGPARNFDWRDAPFTHYESFADFYQQELAATWGAVGQATANVQKVPAWRY
jgi:hypothetical protein